jgi:4-hydroxy-3-polyprenylbenzoate decarboxylase
VKNIVVVDEDCPIHEPSQVAVRVLGLADPANDWLVVKGPLEGAAALGAKAGLDATRKLPGEGRPLAPVRSQPEIRRLVDDKWLEYGIE